MCFFVSLSCLRPLSDTTKNFPSYQVPRSLQADLLLALFTVEGLRVGYRTTLGSLQVSDQRPFVMEPQSSFDLALLF